MIMKNYEEKLLKIDWFSKMGEKDFNNLECFPIRFECLNNQFEMEKKMSSQRWENKTLEEQNIIMRYLYVNSHENRKNWNSYVEEAKAFIDKVLMVEWRKFQVENGVSEDFISSVKWDVMHFILYSKFSEEIDGIPTFFLDLIRIYESGHIPCGWSGKMDKGFLFVY